MSWDTITSIADIFGTIAIVVSLIYVARQMREANRERKLESYRAVVAEIEDFGKLLAHEDANADIWWRASKGLENLSDAERVRYFGMLFILFRSWEKLFHHHRDGEIEDRSARGITKSVTDFAMSRGVQEYWALRKRWFTPEFQDWVDTKMKERSGVDIYGEQFRMFGSADSKDHA